MLLVAFGHPAAAGPAAGGAPAPTGSSPIVAVRASGPARIVLIMMENKSYKDIIGSKRAPYLNGLAERYETYSHFYAAEHPSLKDYLVVTSGGHPAQCKPSSCSDDDPNLVDQLEAAGRSWRQYSDSYPTRGHCDLKDVEAIPYVKRHVPWLYYSDIVSNPTRCAKMLGFFDLLNAIQSKLLPAFSFLTPNVWHDMHTSCKPDTQSNCPPGSPDEIRQGDEFLKSWIPRVMSALSGGDKIIIAWDEGRGGDTSGCCQLAQGGHTPLLVVGPNVAHAVKTANYDTFSILAGIEAMFGLPRLKKAGCNCTPELSL
jgi:acid phosphatase